MPLPAVLRPDSAEGPLFAVLIDTWDRFEEVKSLASLGDLLIGSSNVSVGLPLVRAELSVFEKRAGS